MARKLRADELAISTAVEKYLFEAGGEATIRQIRRAFPHYFELTDDDRRLSQTRPGEEIWEQQIRNIVCHRDSEGNAINSGRIRYAPGKLILADGPQRQLL